MQKAFVLCSVPGTFSHNMDVILSLDKWQFALICLTHFISLSPADEHIEHVHTVLSELHRAEITLNGRKWKFITKKVYYLVHVIRPVVGTRFSYHGRNIRLKTTSNSNRTEVILVSMQRKLTLRFQLCPNGCPTQLQAENGGTQTVQPHSDWRIGRFRSTTAEPSNRISACIVSMHVLLGCQQWCMQWTNWLSADTG